MEHTRRWRAKLTGLLQFACLKAAMLVDPTPEMTLLDIGAVRHELLQLLGVPVDVLTPTALPDKFRAAVLAEAVAV